MMKRVPLRSIVPSLFLLLVFISTTGCVPERRSFSRHERSYELGKEILAHTGGQMLEATDSSGLRSYQGGKPYHTPISERGLTRELLFVGVSDQVMEVMYREFSIDISSEYVRDPYTGVMTSRSVDRSGLARPAFYLTMKFDLRKSTQFVCKDWRIKVTGVGSSSIRFQVLEEIGKYASRQGAPSREPGIGEDAVVPHVDME